MRPGKGGGRKDRVSDRKERHAGGSQECPLLERMSVRVKAGKARGGGWKGAGPGPSGRRPR